MRLKSARWAMPTFAVLAFSAIFLTVGARAQSELRPSLTSHVPDAVASGLAPMVGHLPAQQRMSLAISLSLRNPDQLEAFLQDLYNPSSPNYRHYLTVAQFADRFGATADDYNSVIQFAQANHLTVRGTGANRLVVDVEGAVADIEAAFHTSMGVYQHPTEARTFYAPEREPLAATNVSLLHISGLDNFVLPVAKNTFGSGVIAKASGSGPSGSFLGSDLRTAYYGSGSLNGAGQTVALFEYKGYNPTDIN